MEAVYLLQHSHTLPSGEEDVKIVGVYRTRSGAALAVERLAKAPGFSDHARLLDPTIDHETDGFYIDEYRLDIDHWSEGHFTAADGE